MTQAAQVVTITRGQTIMTVSAGLFTFLALTGHSLVSGLDPGSYGTGEDPSITKEGYKTAYARAKAAREMAFAKKAEKEGAVAPQELILQQDYQVPSTFHISSRNVNLVTGATHSHSGAKISVLLLH